MCLHGAGHSALSFAVFAKHLKEHGRVFAFDFRGHGDHTCENETDMSQETLIRDTLEIIAYLSENHPDDSIVLVGHSMGGSIACKTVERVKENEADYPYAKQIQGLFVIDVVEGTAMDALPFMEQIVTSRPKAFKSL